MIVLNCQYWEGDRAQAMELARLIADLEPVKRDDVVFMFTARFDCKHDEKTIAYVAQKFKVLRYTTSRKATGWPNGPNQMMGESYHHLVEIWMKGKLPGIKGVLFMEADCVPLDRNWINLIVDEWQRSGKQVYGAWLKPGDAGVEHINGNCIISMDFWRKNKAIFHPPEQGGWDATLAYCLLPQGAASSLIWSDYRLGTSDNSWKGCDYLWASKRYGSPHNELFGRDLHPVYFHGCKVMNGLKCARQRLLNEQP